MEGKTLYFEEPGKGNTEATLVAARDRAGELGLNQLVVATTHGYTAVEAARVFGDTGTKIVAVSISAAYDANGWTMTAGERRALEDAGVTVLTSIHSLGDDVNEAFGVIAPNRIVRETLYTFCQGMKVAVEIALMAADAGLVDMESELVAVAGTGEGADTAIVLRPAYTRTFKELRIREIIAKAR